MEGKQVIAERSSWVWASIAFGIMAGICFSAAVWIIIESINTPGVLPTLGATCFGFVLFLVFAIVYTIKIKNIPPILAEYSDGVIYFYPAKNEQIAVKPEEIRFVSQKNYSSRYGTYSSGKLEIELYQRQTIVLKYVSDVDKARRLLESIKERSIKSAAQ